MSEQEAAPARRMNRTLTQKYDMQALRALQVVETELGQKLCELIGCEEDEHGVDIDLLGIYQSDASEREQLLKDMFVSVTQDTSALQAEILAKMEELSKNSTH